MIRNLHLLILTPLILLNFIKPDKISAQAADGCHQFRTQTPGGWGSSASGNNPGAYRDAHFDAAFPDGISLGCFHTLRFTSAQAVQNFLPSGSTPRALEESFVDPTSYNNALAGHLLALTLSVGFDVYDPNFAPSQTLLGDQIVANGLFAGFAVHEILAEADNVLGGCISDYSASQVATVLASINENYVDGVHNNGFLECPETESACSIQVESTATDCTSDGTYVLTIGVSGSNGSFAVVAPNAISGNGAALCFASGNNNTPSFQEVVLTFAQGDGYAFSITGLTNAVCTAPNNGSNCSIGLTEGPGPNCCALEIECFDPGITSFSCPSEFPAATPEAITYSDNCGEVNVTVNETFQGSGCAGSPYQLIRTYSVTDGSNTQTCTHVFQAADTEAPVISCPAPQYADCDSEILPDVMATATDNCSSDVYISFSNGVASGCASFVRTWVAVDGCGNTSYCYQTVYLTDNTPPVLTTPADATVDCSASLSTLNLGRAYATDLCSYVTITYEDGPTQGEGCTTSFVRTWIATDACGNMSTGDQTITQTDLTGPVIYDVPPSASIQCGEAPLPADAYAIDQCSGATLPVNFIENVNINGCRTTITRTYTATDDCGNSTTRYQNITIEDTEGPQMVCPADVLLECGDEAYTPEDIGMVEANDNCSGAYVTVTYQDSERNNNACPPTIERLWTAVDTCGNVSNCVQRIMFDDQQAPEITCLDNITVNCAESSILPDDTGTPTATDGCSVATITYMDGIIQGGCPVSFVRTWKATDACGNAAYCYQTITVIDEIAPEITCPADISISCAYSNALPSRTGFPVVVDQCLSVSYTYQDGPISGECPKVFTRTWTATDYCGNTASCEQQISLEDNMLPVVFCPADAVVGCDDDLSPESLGIATAVDFCNSVSVSHQDTEVEGACPAAIARVWTATDACGNARSCTQLITFEAVGLPEIICPADIAISCDEGTGPEITGQAIASSTCASVSITYTDSVANTTSTGGNAGEGCGPLRTQTQGGWGSAANGNNPGSYRDAHFDAAFPNGLVVGCDYNLTLTSSAAVQAFLPSGGPVRVLDTDIVDPNNFTSVLAGQLIAATLSVGFDANNPDFGEAEISLGNMVIANGEFAGWTVNEVLEEANRFFGGCESAFGGSQLVQVLTGINESHVDGTQNSSFLDCPESEDGDTEGCGAIYRTWTATNDCGNTSECVQIITRTDGGVDGEGRAVNNGLVAYPSPTNDIVYLSPLMDATMSGTLEVVSLSGTVILSKAISGDTNRTTLGLGALETGFYIIRWVSGDEVHSARVFKH
jgi:hypothetical protein